MKTQIHQTAREILKRELPMLDICGPDMWSFCGMCLFSPWIDEDTGAIRVGLEVVARSVGKNHMVYVDVETGKKSAPNFKAKTVLDVFTNVILPGRCEVLDYVAPSQDNPGLQRRIIVNWPDAVKQMVEDELTGKYDHEERVYIKDGSKVSYRKQKALLDADKLEAANINDVVACASAKNWTKYLNNLPTNVFTMMLKNFDTARAEALKITNPHAKMIALKQLDIIREQPLPIYKATPRTTRIYTMSASLQNLPKSIRKVLMQGHTEFDLHHAQLAIVAKLWKIPSVDAFLSSGKSLWAELINHMGLDVENMTLDEYEDVKWYLKKYTYATIFGMNEDNLVSGNVNKVSRLKKLGVKTAAKKVNGLDADLQPYGIKNAGTLFTSYPLIAELLAARNRMLAHVRTVFGLTNAYGELITIKPGQDERDVLAQVAQSYELYLLDGVLDFAKKYKDYLTVTNMQHDGFSVKFHKTEYKDQLIETLVKGVNDWCKAHSINTWLEYSENEVLENQPVFIQADLVDAALNQPRDIIEAPIANTAKTFVKQYCGKLLDDEAIDNIVNNYLTANTNLSSLSREQEDQLARMAWTEVSLRQNDKAQNK